MNDETFYNVDDRTEEVQHIIERMPTRFGFFVGLLILFLFAFLFVFGWIVRYPDIVTGQIVISGNNAPLKLIANSNGKIKLNHINSMDLVKQGQLIAYVENPTNYKSVFFIDSLLRSYVPLPDTILKLRQKLPPNFSLGELNSKYYGFANSLQEYANYKQDKLIDKQSENLNTVLIEQKEALANITTRIDMATKSLYFVQKSFKRDSLLFTKKIISESELDKTQMNYLSSKDALQNNLNNSLSTRQQIEQTEGQIEQLSLQNPEKGKELRISLISAYNDLLDNIKSWEQKYAFIAPFTGKVQFLKFYNENQFIQANEEVFSIVPKEEKVYGQVTLPAQGSGKIKIGQEVIVKLDNYPYMEYGSITGRIKSIALTTSTAKTETSIIDTYLIVVDFPNQLTTNYKTRLNFKADAKGTAEIITKDRRLIQRLFDNLKYAVRK
ncbi:MAG: HlyD family efflux transporter periplasmic adaptor subunit [Mucilaginibacter sp.]|nr:HlyD family efflux transporter periplasmic adaptor subunit [Mucilaginibacter sp.]